MDNFAKRLLEACNASDEIPEYGKGQQTHLASLLNVSQEAVRKWFAGETVPRASMSMKLAEILNVKHSWLMLGTAHGEIEADVRIARRHNAASYAMMCYLVATGRGASFSAVDSVDDITFIENGRMIRLCVEMASRPKDGVHTVVFTDAQRKAGVTVAMVADYQQHHSASMDVMEITDKIWETHGMQEGKNFVLHLEKSQRGYNYSTNGEKLKKFLEE